MTMHALGFECTTQVAFIGKNFTVEDDRNERSFRKPTVPKLRFATTVCSATSEIDVCRKQQLQRIRVFREFLQLHKRNQRGLGKEFSTQAQHQ
jgi:hypothetical protein